jgi:hypothetical protein
MQCTLDNLMKCSLFDIGNMVLLTGWFILILVLAYKVITKV